MLCIYLQTITTDKKVSIPYRLTVKDAESSEPIVFNFRPDNPIPKRIYEQQHLDRLAVLSAPPFCDSADELIDVFQTQDLLFSEAIQFQLLKSQFRTIGYNFNIKPKYLFYKTAKDEENPIEGFLKSSKKLHPQSSIYAEAFVEIMAHYTNETNVSLQPVSLGNDLSNTFEFSSYKMAPGVYYFLDEFDEVIYVGKAKNIRKRLQSHFSQQTRASTIDYSKVKSINAEYSGTDILAQLIESANIKALKPVFNTQQIKDPAPFVINKGKTAKGIHKLQITRKETKDNMPEKYFNRLSVKGSLEKFCSEYNLCRKHCGLENVKGPCSKSTVHHEICVCAGTEALHSYNKRFDIAFYNFKNRKDRKIYKLKGRHKDEAAFIYLVNSIYEGYGFIDNSEPISNVNDILGHLIPQINNYDTSRIVSVLDKTMKSENILILDII